MHMPSQSLQPHLNVELSFRSKLLIFLNSPASTLAELKRLMKVGVPANLTAMGKAEETPRKPLGSLTHKGRSGLFPEHPRGPLRSTDC